ncbi:hypothetical protein C2I06_07905 [Niallia circulans]|uniref:Uncharacterized protein n=1 Tax=Niallia circulans TaxID=1397 RepID=A0A268F9K8_NIACI|nr:hypothetical protein [Niallia circulans]AYV66805.1 hypothetical protein C2I06_07905 [Niallia circulans]AYV70340.1 hypothetical protein C2H98_01455 [Niallia circulans]PAD82053.1 hypothetical protein CHH57_16745 [Niallia circulans]
MKINDKASFHAYTQLSLVSRFKKHMETGNKYGNNTVEEMKNRMGFSTFNEAIKDNKIINKDLARDTSSFHKGILEDRLKHSGNTFYSGQVSEIVNKAFKLGLVGNNEYLISKYKESI